MKRKFLAARGVIAVLFVMLLCVCVAVGVFTAMPRAVYAEEGGAQVDTGDGEENQPETPDIVQAINRWEKAPYIDGWVSGSYKNTLSAKPLYGEAVFSVLNADGNAVYDVLTNFKTQENGALPQNVSDRLSALGAGKYVLKAVVEETESYSGLESEVKFTVKALNSWLIRPAVLSWKYGEYDPAVNFIQAVPAYGEVMIYIFDSDERFAARFSLDKNNAVPPSASEELGKLDAGEYFMLAMVKGTDDYTSLNENVANVKRDGIRFSVLKINNSWKTTPNIVQWSWGNYKKAVNTITAVPSYPQNSSEVEVRFGVYTDASCYDSYAVPGLEDFTTSAGIVNSSVERVLNRLNAGTYYLFATSAGTKNYTTLSSIIQFTVQPVQNNWVTSPNLLQWTWGEYDRSVNEIKAEPKNGGIENVVFGIYSDVNCNDKISEPFSYNRLSEVVYGEDGTPEIKISYKFDEEIYKLLEKLSAGTYYLKAELSDDENGNYTGLSSKISFNVQNVQNHWVTTPSVLAWKYGEYDKSVNLIQAESALGTASIAVYHDNGEALLFNNGKGLTSSFYLSKKDGKLTVPEYVENVLKTLSVGTYYMLASVPAEKDGNYSGLNEYTSVEDIKAHGIEFSVTTVENGWVDIPKILSWSEGHYDGEVNKIVARAKSGNERMIIYVMDSSGRVLTSSINGELDYSVIENLPVGSYTLRCEVSGTNNYTALAAETTFAVFEDSVGLNGIIASVIVFTILDVFAAAMCIILLVYRRKKVEEAYRTMIRKELHRR